MDHLFMAMNDLAMEPVVVPLLINDRFKYDDLGFLSYPERAGVDLDQILERSLSDVDSLAPALQAWLWFGLLGEVLRIGSRPFAMQRVASFRAFVAENPDGQEVISTQGLLDCISKAGDQNRSMRPDNFYSERYYACLRAATNTIRKLLSSDMCQQQLERKRRFQEFPKLFHIILSIQILIETLDASSKILYVAKPGRLPEPRGTCSGHELVDRLLSENGWCKSEIARLPCFLRLRYYCCFLRRPLTANDWKLHSHCTSDTCVQLEVEDRQIKPKHAVDSCQCAEESINGSSLYRITESGGIPLIQHLRSKDGTPHLQLREARMDSDKPSVRFVAVSHVRRVGLGNSASNSLPSCQLASIQKLVDQLGTTCVNKAISTNVHNIPSTSFWLDTMCVPLHSNLHRLALDRISQVFKCATFVLVLDHGLSTYLFSSPEDALIRIRLSRWKRRLWTLQEGFLVSSSRLMFRFSNQIVSLRSLIDSYETTCPLPLLEYDRLEGFRVLPVLSKVLEMFDSDIKALARLPESMKSAMSKPKLRTMLRLGYLSAEDYRYFRDDLETKHMVKVLPVLDEVYLDCNGLPIKNDFSQADVVSRLSRIQQIDI